MDVLSLNKEIPRIFDCEKWQAIIMSVSFKLTGLWSEKN